MRDSSAHDDLKPRKSRALLDPVLKRVWRRFRAKFPAPADCLAAIGKELLDQGVVYCKTCNLQEWGELDGRLAECLHCGDKTSVTAGTFFDHMRAYRAWLAAIWFAERGIVVSSTTFKRLLNIALSSARFILKRVWTALQGQMDQGTVTVPQVSFLELICRNCTEPYASRPPASAESSYETGSNSGKGSDDSELECQFEPSANAENSADASIVLDKEEPGACAPATPSSRDLILRALGSDSLSADELSRKTALPIWETSAMLTELELTGECERLPGSRFVVACQADSARSTNSRMVLDSQTQSAVKASLEYLHSVFNGVGGKYLHLYLVAHFCHATGSQPRKPSVINSCIRYGKTTCRQIFQTRAKEMVRVFSMVSAV